MSTNRQKIERAKYFTEEVVRRLENARKWEDVISCMELCRRTISYIQQFVPSTGSVLQESAGMCKNMRIALESVPVAPPGLDCDDVDDLVADLRKCSEGFDAKAKKLFSSAGTA